MIIKNSSHVSNDSATSSSSSQPPTTNIPNTPKNNMNPENETVPIEAKETQNHSESRHIQYHITDQFRFLYRRFHQLLAHLATGAPKFQTTTSSLRAFFTFQAVQDWLSHLVLAGGTTFIADDKFNDRIADFLQQNWTMSPWF
ncbi:uncharacterized protein DFL_004159 [Arthrobotrys flagrans]|uniref:Uncharacterized protein n=1 Tax=Arthrobotrys flagrans TaxID=97331 RepID=A0A437A407_ARTFL|nr:hypothetical protein DFL_004159 [Arthrobotrys flagrans]